ncbi:hypothetical protein M3Y99_00727500 [Aphelenchoides fujianensis]|nr:hypothetical protein M3Y99_00727500 [Aphelenchoides fujianensis]
MPPGSACCRWATVLLVGFLLVEATAARLESSLSAATRRNEKVLLRTKRQHCTCLNVRVATPGVPSMGPGLDPLDSTYRCTCNSATNPNQQQRELQQILQQVEPLSHCSCTPGGLAGGQPANADSPFFELQQQQQQWDCTCIGGQTQRPAPPQFFPWNRPAANAAPIQQQQEQPLPPPPPQYPNTPPPSYNQEPLPQTTQSPPPLALSAPSTPGYAQQSTPLLPLPSDLNTYRDPINYQGPFQGPPPQFPLRQNQVIVSVIRTDSTGRRYPLGNPACVCTPTISGNNQPLPYRPLPSPVLQEPVRQPLVPPQPQYQPPLPTTPATTPSYPTLPPTYATLPPSPPPTFTPPPPTPAPRPPIVSPSPAPLPVPTVSIQTNGRSYYDVVPQAFRPASPAVYPTYSYGPPAASVFPSGLAADEPMTPCIMISIGGLTSGRRQCQCPDAFRQCSPTQCCNHKAYRSIKQAAPTINSATPSAVDLLLEFAESFKKHWNAQKTT